MVLAHMADNSMSIPRILLLFWTLYQKRLMLVFSFFFFMAGFEGSNEEVLTGITMYFS